MKVLFLDIDGVLNSREVIEREQKANVIDRAMVERLNAIWRATDCKIVISSTWRLYHTPRQLIDRLQFNGFLGEIIGQTPDLLISENGNRGLEIQSWLHKHPSVTQFVILDDDVDEDMPFGNIVQTSFKDGLQDHHVKAAISVLNK